MRPDVVVIGAGIVGAAIAETFAQAGAHVRVVDRAPAGGTTAAAMGHVLIVDDDPALLALTQRGRALWQQRSEELPAAAQWDAAGTLWVATNDAEMTLARNKAANLRAHGAEAEVVDSAELRALEPELAGDLPGALRVPGDRTLYPPAAAMWLLRRAQQHGADLAFGDSVHRVEGTAVHLKNGQRLDAGAVVIATGHRAELLPARLATALRPKKGHLAITDRYANQLRHHVAELGYLASTDPGRTEAVAFNVQPRAGGQLLVGACRQLDHDDDRIDKNIVGRMFRRAVRFVPSIATLDVLRIWTGIRPATNDGRPLIGAVPDAPGLHVAVGHEGLGITNALVSAELIAAEVLDLASAIDATPYAPGRSFAEPVPPERRPRTEA